MRIVALAAFFLFSTLGSFAQKPSNQSKPSAPILVGTIADNVYRNPELGLSYKLRYGWVDRTQQMRDDSNDPAKAQVLLATFERPPEVTGDSVNSAVIIAMERTASYPGMKSAADYFVPLTEATTAKGFKVVNEPYEVTIGTKTLARSDFSKELGKLTIYQSSLVILAKGNAVSFTFIASSEDEIQDLIDHLSFGVATVPKH